MTSWHLEELMAEQEHEPHNYCQNPTCADGASYATDTLECEDCGKALCRSCAVQFDDYQLCAACNGALPDPSDLPAEAYDADDFRDQMGNQ